MKLSQVLAACLFLVSVVPGHADAQVYDGDVRLYLDMGLVSWSSLRVAGDAGNQDYLETTTTLGVGPAAGPLGQAGLGLGYVATPHLVPTLYFGVQHVKRRQKVEIDDDEVGDSEITLRQWEVRPQLEVPFMPDARFVPYGALGLSINRQVVEDDSDPDESSFGVGPVVALGGHGFITGGASLDIALAFRALFISDDDRAEDYEAQGIDDPKFRELALFFTLGASFWL